MASAVEIVDELMEGLGKSGTKIRQRLETYVRDVTEDLLSEGEGRFAVLKESVIITLDTTNLTHRLPVNYNSISKTAYEIDDDGNPTSVKVEITSEEGAMQRRYAGEYAGARLFHIEHLDNGRSGRGWYLVLGATPDAETRYKLFYYRKATGNDTDLIRKEEHVKVGAKARYYTDMGDPRAQALQTEYMRRKQGFKEVSHRHSPRMSVLVNPRIRKVNALMNDIGEGK